MRFDMTNSMSLACCALFLGLSASAPARAEPDVLDRPALMRTEARTTTSVLLAVHTAGRRIVVAGERGVILWSDDGASHWQQARVPVSVTLTGLSFADDKNGWAIGHSGIVLGTRDGGQSWTKLLDGKQAADIVAAEAAQPGSSPGFIADAQRLVADGADKPFLGVHFSDARNGLVVGAYGLIFSTKDGGASWTPRQARIDNPKGLHLYAIHATEDTVYVAGEQGALFAAPGLDGDFKALRTPYQGSYFGLLTAGKALIVFGMRGNAYWSGDKGMTWQRCDIPGTNTLTGGIRLQDGRVVLVDDGGNVLLSQDDGRRFTRAAMPKTTPLAAVGESADGQLLLAGVRGISAAPRPQHTKGDTP